MILNLGEPGRGTGTNPVDESKEIVCRPSSAILPSATLYTSTASHRARLPDAGSPEEVALVRCFDASAGYPINGFVHEEVADKEYPWPRWLMFRMDWASMQVERECGWKPGWQANRRQPSRVFLPDHGDYIEFESWWIIGQTTHPEGIYLMFPFAVSSARVRIDLGGQEMMAAEDQIPGVCYDYYTAQQWVDLSNDELGVTIALPDNPMVQFGDFHFGSNQQGFSIDRAMLLGWVTNTYWETNFRTHQSGDVHARYRVYPHAGGFDPVMAHQQDLETAAALPLLQHMGEPVGDLAYPSNGTLLRLPEAPDPSQPVFTLHQKPAWAGSGIIVRLYNALSSTQDTRIASANFAT